VQVPAVTNVTVDPLTVQIGVVAEVTTTERPLAVVEGATVKVPEPSTLSPGLANVIVWVFLEIEYSAEEYVMS
jgi:hypothetical protein